jgi:hypothetical protein
LAEAGDEILPANARHQGGWIMRNPAAMTGRHLTSSSSALAARSSAARAILPVVVPGAKRTQDTRLTQGGRRLLTLRQSQVLDSKGD